MTGKTNNLTIVLYHYLCSLAAFLINSFYSDWLVIWSLFSLIGLEVKYENIFQSGKALELKILLKTNHLVERSDRTKSPL